MYILIKNIKKHLGKSVIIRGWVDNVRSSGLIMFIQLRDGTGFIQGIIEKKQVSSSQWEQAQKINRESSLEIKGIIKKHPQKKDIFEVQINDLTIYQIADEYPIGKKEHGPDFLLDYRHLWLRDKKQWAIQRIRNEIIKSTYEFLWQNNFIKIDAPILTPTSCEDTTTLFEVKYFHLGKAYLSQSGQLYLEAGIASHNRVFDFGPREEFFSTIPLSSNIILPAVFLPIPEILVRASTSLLRIAFCNFFKLTKERIFKADLAPMPEIDVKCLKYSISDWLANPYRFKESSFI